MSRGLSVVVENWRAGEDYPIWLIITSHFRAKQSQLLQEDAFDE